MNFNSFNFDTRLAGIDQNGNVIRNKKKKKRMSPNDIRASRESNEEYLPRMKFSLGGLEYLDDDDDNGYSNQDIKVNDNRGDNNHRNNDHAQDKRNNNEPRKSDVQVCTEMLTEFVNTYAANKMNSVVAKNIISEKFSEVARWMAQYNNDKYNDAINSMNRVIILMSTENFSKMLMTVLKEGTLVETNTCKADILRLFNLILDVNSEKITEDVMSTYIDIIVDIVADIDIKLMVDTYGISEDTALDFVVTIPVSVSGIKNDSDIKQFARKFIDVILTDSDDCMKNMDTVLQKKVFKDFFNDPNNGTMKAVGQCMTSSKIILPESDGQVDQNKETLLNCYDDMLYEIMDENDMPAIKMVLRFIIKELKYRDTHNIDVPIIFNIDKAMTYTNIRKAINDMKDYGDIEYLDNAK